MLKFGFLIAVVSLVGVFIGEMGVVSGETMGKDVSALNRVKRQGYVPPVKCSDFGPGVPAGFCNVDSDCNSCGQNYVNCHGPSGPCKWACEPQPIKQCVLA